MAFLSLLVNGWTTWATHSVPAQRKKVCVATCARQSARRQPPHHITDNSAPDTTVRFFEGCHSSHHGHQDLLWHPASGEPGRDLAQHTTTCDTLKEGFVGKSFLMDLPRIPSGLLANSSTICDTQIRRNSGQPAQNAPARLALQSLSCVRELSHVPVEKCPCAFVAAHFRWNNHGLLILTTCCSDILRGGFGTPTLSSNNNLEQIRNAPHDESCHGENFLEVDHVQIPKSL